MIHVEFFAPNAAPAKLAGGRAAETGGAASFLSVLTRERPHPESAPAEITATADEAATDAAEPDRETDDSAMVAIDVEAEVVFDGEAGLFAGAGYEAPTSQDNRLAAAIGELDLEAAVASEPPARQEVREEVAEDTFSVEEEVPVAEGISARQATDLVSGREAASAGHGHVPFRADAQGAQMPPKPDPLAPGGVVSPGGAAVEAAALLSGGTMRGAGDALPTQLFLSRTASGGLSGSQLIAPGQSVASATLSSAAQAEAEPAIPDVDRASLRTVVEPRGNVAVPGVPAAEPESAVPFALFAGDGMRSDRDLPTRRGAYPADLSREFAARVTSMNGTSPSLVRPVQSAPEQTLAVMPAGQTPAWAEIAEGAAQQASGDEVALVSATTPSQTARAYPVLFAAVEPQRVTQQIAEAVRRGTDGSIELALSPKELGTVRMSIHATDTGTAIVMTAERDETMQLLRRHAEMLHDAFRDIGLGTLDLRFGGRDGKAAQPDPGERGAGGIGSSEPVDTPQQPTPRMMSGGLDLRM